MKTALVVLCCAVVLPARLPAQAPGAQAPATLGPGARARLVAASGEVIAEGRLVRLGADSAVLTDGRRSQAYPLGGSVRLQTVVGRRSNAGRGALLGGLIGSVVGGAAGAGADTQGTMSILPVSTAVSGAAVLGLAGFALGGLLGALSSTEVWGPVPGGALRE